MWSLGIVSYILLTGYPPFKCNDLRSIYRTILTNSITYDKKLWKRKSTQALEFVKGWLTSDRLERLTPFQALNHEWIVHNAGISKLK